MADDTRPEGGGDRFADGWVPVPLTEKNYDRDNRAYKIVFEAPKQLLLNPQWEAMVHDELLRNAHRDGLEIEGQIMVTTEDKGAVEISDETLKRDAETREVLKDARKEAAVEAEQRAMGGMSETEMKWRQKMRNNLRDTAEEAFGFVSGALDGTPIAEGDDRKWKIDREAFLDGFFGGGQMPAPVKVDMMVITAEALVAADLGLDTTLSYEPPTVEVHNPPPNIDEAILDDMMKDVEVPDDLSGLDDE